MRNNAAEGKGVFSILIVAIVIAFYLFCSSDFFEVSRVEWTSLIYLDAEQLDTFLDFPPVNAWRLDTKELAADLANHPWIESAKIKWRWPNRIVIEVKERTPVAQLQADGGWLLLDREGNLLPSLEGAFVFSLPIVTNLDLNAPEQLVSTARLINAVPAGLRDYISEWNAVSRAFISRSGTEILIGELLELEKKFVLLEKILEDLELRGERAARIDLRITKNPVVSTL